MNADFFRKLDFNNVPGWDAQKLYAPPNREALIKNKLNAKKAAILLLIHEGNNGWEVPCILRNVYKGVHSNQIGFPGGKPESIDLNLMETAIRESEEEISADPKYIEVLGQLTPMYIPPSNFDVYPYVALYNTKAEFVANDDEVQKVLPIPIAEYLGESKVNLFNLSLKDKSVQVPGFKLPSGEIMWGASSMIFNEFITFLNNSLTLQVQQA